MRRETTKAGKLLIVSVDPTILRAVCAVGESSDWQVEVIDRPSRMTTYLQSTDPPSIVMVDFESTEDLGSLRRLRKLYPDLTIIMLGQSDGASSRQIWERMGVDTYLSKPLDIQQLEWAIRTHLPATTFMADTPPLPGSEHGEPAFFIASSPAMRNLRAQASFLAEADVPVLILGEGGSGKETTARLLHSLSPRADEAFRKVNCAALPGDLLEKELFGCKRETTAGSIGFTPGAFEICSRGTILLDEVTEAPMRVQVNLLQLLKTKTFTRPGTFDVVRVDVRILASSTTNMEHAISRNKLRDDLHECLKAFTVHVPPLRDRKQEMEILSRHLLHKLAHYHCVEERELSPAILDAFMAYSWPGNVRELESYIERHLLDLASQPVPAGISGRQGNKTYIAPRPTENAGDLPPGGNAADGSLRSLVQGAKSDVEKNAISAALQRTGWNRKSAARLLNVSYRTLLYKIDLYHLKPLANASLHDVDRFNR